MIPVNVMLNSLLNSEVVTVKLKIRKHFRACADMRQQADEIAEILLSLIQIPVNIAYFIILTISVVVSPWVLPISSPATK